MKGIIAALILSLAGQPAFAMDFSVVNIGFPVVFGNGPIVNGDAARLRAALLQVPRDNAGLKWLALNSPGGSVDAAIEAGEVLDSFGTITVIPDGSSCASACAAILFVASKYHKVLPGGALGIHTCYDSATRTPLEDCNNRISKFARAHGTDYGAVAAYMAAAAPDGMIWFDAQTADCYGLNRYPSDKEPPGYKHCVYEAIRRVVACTKDGTCKK